MRLYTLGWQPCYHWHCRICPVFGYEIQICWTTEGVGIQLQCMGEKVNHYVVSLMEMDPLNLLVLCDESKQMVKNIAKRSSKGQLTSSSTQAQAQPIKALGHHTLLKEGCPATQAWVHYAWHTVTWYWPAQFHHCYLLHLAELCQNHSCAAAYTL